MKKILSLFVMALLALSVVPLVVADGAEVGGDVGVDIAGSMPVIYEDITQRSWYPNDQTYNTAEEYGVADTNIYGDDFYDVPARGNYLFTGETLTRYVIVEDRDGESTIDAVMIIVDGVPVGSCSELVGMASPGYQWVDSTSLDGIDPVGSYVAIDGSSTPLVFDDAIMNVYRCVAIVQSTWSDLSEIGIRAVDDEGNIVDHGADWIVMNPSLQLTLTGTVDFGSNVRAGDTVTSNSVRLNNIGNNGVVMDMYIASDDYFTDPSNPLAICGLGNGIPYTAFSYYATKGSLDSGDNDGSYLGLGADCLADADEFTPMPSHSGDIEDMCRIINHVEEGSFLTQGQSMSLTFQLEVPTPCSGQFTNGQFHFVGRVI